MSARSCVSMRARSDRGCELEAAHRPSVTGCGALPTVSACIAAYGLNRNQGQVITEEEIEREADELRLACRDALCRSKERRNQFADAVTIVETTEDTLPR